MIEVSALASGSSGNSFFIESNKSSFLVDAGISCKQAERRMEMIGKDASALKGIFITHEHTDHIRGVDVLSRKYSIPVFLTKECYSNCSHIVSDSDLVRFVEKNKAFRFNGANILPFPKSHDAHDPVSYTVISNGRKISVMTDIGVVCSNVIKNFRDSNIVFLESNHDVDMLKNGPYPAFLKERILSDGGHLSNYEASLLVLEHTTHKLKHVVLSHLSENNNTEEIALKTMKSLLQHRKDLKKLQIHISGRHEPTELISI